MRRLALVLLLVCPAALVSCVNVDVPVDPRVAVSGDYDLQSLNGVPTPILTSNRPDMKYYLVASRMTISALGGWTETTGIKRVMPNYPDEGSVSEQEGTWTYDAATGTVTLAADHVVGRIGTIVGSVMTLTIPTTDSTHVTYVYKK